MKVINEKLIMTVITTLVMLVGAASAVMAAPPSSFTVSFQARNATTGNVLKLVNADVTVNVYAAPTGGSPLWNQTKTRSTSEDGFGYFYATGVTLPFDVPYYYCIKVDGMDECAARINLTAVPYAFFALNSSWAAGVNYYDVSNAPENSTNSSWTSNSSFSGGVSCEDIVQHGTDSDFCEDASVAQLTQEEVQDYVGNAFNSQGNGSITYDDASDEWDLVIAPSGIDYNDLLNVPGLAENSTNASWATSAGNSSFCSAFNYFDGANLPSIPGVFDDSAVNGSLGALAANWTYFFSTWQPNASQWNTTILVQAAAYADSVAGGVYDDAWLNTTLDNLSQVNDTLYAQCVAYADANDADTVYNDAARAQNDSLHNSSITALQSSVAALPVGNYSQEDVEDIAGAMFDGTQQNISFTYNDGTGNVDAIVTVTGIDCAAITGTADNVCVDNIGEAGSETDPLWSANWTNLSQLNSSIYATCTAYADANDADTVYSDVALVANWTAYFAWLLNASQWNVTILAQAAAYADANDDGAVFDDGLINASLGAITTNQTTYREELDNLSQVNETLWGQCTAYADANDAAPIFDDGLLNASISGLITNDTAKGATISSFLNPSTNQPVNTTSNVQFNNVTATGNFTVGVGTTRNITSNETCALIVRSTTMTFEVC